MNENQNILCRRSKKTAPVLQRRSKTPILHRRQKPETLQRRKKPDVFYCEKKSIRNRLPYPIECHWIGEMYEHCRNCTRKIKYSFWKRGTYDQIAKALEDRTYKANSSEEASIRTFIAKEEEGR